MLQAERKWVQKAASQLLLSRAIRAWMQFCENQKSTRDTTLLARRHFTTTLMSRTMQGWQRLCVGAAIHDYGCEVAVGIEECRQHELHTVCNKPHPCGMARPKSAGAGPKVGKRALVVVGHVREGLGHKVTQPQRCRSAPRPNTSRKTRYASQLQRTFVGALIYAASEPSDAWSRIEMIIQLMLKRSKTV